jgi:hypothetical protein
MTADAQGFDPELDYTAVDNPFWDCTDGAHPAWWRGEEWGVKSMVRLVHEWLDKPLSELESGTHYEDVQALKERILDLRRKA